MQLADRIRIYLEQQRKAYAVVSRAGSPTLPAAAKASAIDPERLVRAVLLEDDNGLLLVVLPSSHLIDFNALYQLLGRRLKPTSRDRASSLFSDCEPGCIPPLPAPYDLPAVLDSHLCSPAILHFEAGSQQSLVRMQSDDFTALFSKNHQARVSRPLSCLESRDAREFMLPGDAPPITDLRPLEDIRRSVEQVERLPSMPAIGKRLLRLANNPHATLEELTSIIQADPSLTAQIIRYARAAFFGYRGNVDTLAQAVTRVLGFETVLNMCLGLAASRTFNNPADGPLGLQAFWKHAAYSAALAQRLAKTMTLPSPLKPGLAYLCGLLHNFGFLLAGHLFRAEFFLLNRVVAANPQLPVAQLEQRVLGVEHTQIGAWLMDAWDMPGAVVVSTREHHNEQYSGEHADYARLMWCVDGLLQQHGIGETNHSQSISAALNTFGLDLAQAQAITQDVLACSEALDAMARQMAA